MVYPTYNQFRLAHWIDEKGELHPTADLVEDGISFEQVYEFTCVNLANQSLLYSPTANLIAGNPFVGDLMGFIRQNAVDF